MNSPASIRDQVGHCRRCGPHGTRQHAVPGEGPAEPEIFIGQAPGRNEDRTGRPFVGMAGRFLNGVFREVGMDRKRVFLTGAVKCFPPRNHPPSWQEISACRPFSEAQLRATCPELIVCLGSAGASALFMEPVRVWEARMKPLSYGGTPVFVTYHPAAAMRFPEIRARLIGDLRAVPRPKRRLAPAGILTCTPLEGECFNRRLPLPARPGPAVDEPLRGLRVEVRG